METNNAVKKRDSFTSKWGFILACIGSAVGVGNIWRFPIMVSIWGGMDFIIPYLIFVVLIGSTGVIEEFALGRSAKAGPIGAFGYVTELRYGNRKVGERIGLIPIFASLALAIGYTVVTGWIIKYTVMAFSGEMMAMGTDMDVIGGTFDRIAVSNAPWIIIGMAVTFVIMAMGVSKGIEKANKVMMPILFALFVGLAIYIATLPGAKEGYKYIFTLDPAKLKDPLLWIFAFGQAFFSLSVAGSGSVIYGSYLPDDEDLPKSAFNVALFDTIAAMLAALVIIPAMAVGNAPMDQGGPGLMFIWLVNVLNGMPGGRGIEMIFFLSVLFAALSSIINLYESSLASLQENVGLSRPASTAITLGGGVIVALLIQAITGEWMDVVSIYILPLGAFFAGVMFFWVGGREYNEKAVNQGRKDGKPLGNYFYVAGKYIYVPLCIVALVAGIILGGIG